MTSLHPSQKEDDSINLPSNSITKNIQWSKRRQNTLFLTLSVTTENAYKRLFLVDFEPTVVRTINQYYVVDAIEELASEEEDLVLTTTVKLRSLWNVPDLFKLAEYYHRYRLETYLVKKRVILASTQPKVSYFL